MSGANNSGVIPMQKAIEHYFQIALYLLVLTGFGTLAGTGGLDLASIVLVATALAVRGYLLAKGRTFVISERWTTPLSLAYVVFFAIDCLAVSRVLPATIHLALFAVVVRMFSLRRERDHVTLAILAFLLVLASAVLTVDSTFLFCFAAFMLTAVATFVLMEMRRSGIAANIQARHSSDPQEHRHLVFALVRFAPALMLMILVCAAGLFFVMPRMSAGYLGAYSYGTDFSSGFSDHVQLGQIGQIQQSDSVVMHIQIDGDKGGLYDLYWRGVTLADFDGHTWSNHKDASPLWRRPDTSFALPSDGPAPRSYATASLKREKLLHYKVLMESIGTNVFFLAPRALSLEGDYRLVEGDSGGAVYDYDFQRAISRYEATSDIATPSATQLRAAGRNYPAKIAEIYLRLPETGIDGRIPQLAAQITRTAKSDYDKATVIENYLRSRFGYTLQLPQREVEDPIANFLFERKQGHCEYFASSMAVMLRTLGIPSRVVNGFRSDEFNDITGRYVVRAKDAHSWVEAYFPGYGWQTFDPTPAAGVGTPQGWGRFALYLDAAASFWRDWVVTYDSSNQYVLTRGAINTSRGVWEGARLWARRHYASMLRWAQRSQEQVENSPRRSMLIGGGMVLALAWLANLGWMARFLHENWLGSHPERSPEQAAAIWYQRMTRVLAREGIGKNEAETPQEFAGKIQNIRLRLPVEHFTKVYESARFGNSSQDARRLPELFEEVQAATRSE